MVDDPTARDDAGADDDALGAVLTRTVPTDLALADAHHAIGRRIAVRRRRRAGTRVAVGAAVAAVLALAVGPALDDDPTTVVVDEPTTVLPTPSTEGAPSPTTTPVPDVTASSTSASTAESTVATRSGAPVACDPPTVPGPDGVYVALYCGTNPMADDPLVVVEVDHQYEGSLVAMLERSLVLLQAGAPPIEGDGTATAIARGFIGPAATVTVDGLGAVVLDLDVDLTAVPNASTSNVTHRLTRQLLATFFAYEEVASVTLTDCIGDQMCPLLVPRAEWLAQEAAEPAAAGGPVEDGSTVVPLPDVSDVSIGAGGAFVTGFAHDPTGVTAWYAARVDVLSGFVDWRTPLERVARRIVATPGVVWVFGGGDGGESQGGFVALDPETGAILAGPDHSDAMGPYDAVAVGDELWVSNNRGSVVRIAVEDGEIVHRATIPVDGQPSDVVLTDDGRLWARVYDLEARINSLVELDPATTTVVATYDWDGPIHDTAPGGTIWAQQTPDGPVLTLSPDALADGLSVALGTRLPGVRFPSVVTVGDEVWVGNGNFVVRYGIDEAEIARLGPYDDARVLAATPAEVWFLGDRVLRRAPA
jgi:hypothetical protein